VSLVIVHTQRAIPAEPSECATIDQEGRFTLDDPWIPVDDRLMRPVQTEQAGKHFGFTLRLYSAALLTVLLSSSGLLSGALGSQPAPVDLRARWSYQGWSAGIALDSAQRLARRDYGAPLECRRQASDPGLYCTARHPGRLPLPYDMVLLQLPEGDTVRSVQVERALPTNVTRDELAKAFVERWGPATKTPDSLEMTSQMIHFVGVWESVAVSAHVTVVRDTFGSRLSVSLLDEAWYRRRRTDAAAPFRP
jgi:hypothetical protein